MTNELQQLESALAPDTEAAGKAYREIIHSIANGDTEIASVADEVADCCTIMGIDHETAVADVDALREIDVITKRRRAFKRQSPKLQRERDEIGEQIAAMKAMGTGPGRKSTHKGVQKLLNKRRRCGLPWNLDRDDEKRLAEIERNSRLFDQPEAENE